MRGRRGLVSSGLRAIFPAACEGLNQDDTPYPAGPGILRGYLQEGQGQRGLTVVGTASKSQRKEEKGREGP
jgi:hypothetical protein